MIKLLLPKFISAVISSVIAAMLSTVVFFTEDIPGMLITGVSVFLFLFGIAGVPFSFLISMLYKKFEENLHAKFIYMLYHAFGGLFVSILFMAFTESREEISIVLSGEFIPFYALGAGCGLLFSMVELIARRQ